MAPGTILCFGDSNTHGTRAMRHAEDRRRWDRADRWPDVMATDLGADWDVLSEGHPGRTTVHEDPVEGAHKSGRRVLLSLLESHRPLDLVIVMLGTNDLKAQFGLTPEDIVQGVMQLVEDIKESDSGPDGQAPQVLVAAPVEVIETGYLADMFAGAAPKSKAFACVLEQAVQACARRGLGFVDLNTVAKVDPVDGIHLNKEAHAAIGMRMAQAVREMLT